MTRNFWQMLHKKWGEGKLLGVVLGTSLENIPQVVTSSSHEDTLYHFCRWAVEATKDLACAFILKLAHFEAIGAEGHWALGRLISHIHDSAFDVPVILDGGFDSDTYAPCAFNHYKADGVTINPYRGLNAHQLFLNKKEKGIIVLCCTPDTSTEISRWNSNSNCGVMAAGYTSEQLRALRKEIGEGMCILVSEVLLEDVEHVVPSAADKDSKGLIIATEAILAAGSIDESPKELSVPETPEFAEKIRAEALRFAKQIPFCPK